MLGARTPWEVHAVLEACVAPKGKQVMLYRSGYAVQATRKQPISHTCVLSFLGADVNAWE